MELSTAIVIAAFVACPIAMGAAMWLMNRKMNEPRRGRVGTSSSDRPADLRAQRRDLEAEIAEVTRLLDLEAKRAALHEEPGLDAEHRVRATGAVPHPD